MAHLVYYTVPCARPHVDACGPCRPIYVTRHRIDSHAQSRRLCREVASEMFVPCAAGGGHDEARPVRCVWHVFRSELALFVLHMTTLVFAVVKASA